MEVNIYENYVIYKITNVLNGMVYIGQTNREATVRWTEHKYRASSGTGSCKKLYNAMRKYGAENFTFEVLVSKKMAKTTANKLEIEYIKKHNSFENGYNMTIGGDGTKTICLEERKRVVKMYKNGKSLNDIFTITGHAVSTIRGILKASNIEIIHRYNQEIKKRIQAIDLITNEVVLEFDSCYAAGVYFNLPEPKKTHISECLTGKRKTYKGYAWRLA